LKTWIEDFVDEDTGEVVSIERNEVFLDRETILENHHIDIIADSGEKHHPSQRKVNSADFTSFTTHFKKILRTQKKKRWNTSTVS
jgi:DNA-directed RNA polymerase subunit beta